MRSLIHCLAGIIVVIFCAQTLAQTGVEGGKSKPLVFGFLPIVSSERLVRRFSPLTDYLSGKLGTEIRMETAPDFKSFVDRTHAERRYDILFTAPHLYYLANKNSRDQPRMYVGRLNLHVADSKVVNFSWEAIPVNDD